VTMTYAQIVNPHGLRSLEHSLNSNTTCLYHLGISKEVKRSTISYANNTRSPEVFEKLFYFLSSTLNRNERKKFRKKFYGIDATELSLNLHDFPWATFRSTMSGVKIHLKYDINNSLPEYLFITNANEHENNTLKKMNFLKGCIVAFDKGYCEAVLERLKGAEEWSAVSAEVRKARPDLKRPKVVHYRATGGRLA